MLGKIADMKTKYKDIELSGKSLGAAMFMATVCLYMAIGALSARLSGADFYYHIPFVFLVHGVIISLLAAGVWVINFGLIKTKGFGFRFLFTLIILTALFGISIKLPVINSNIGYELWIISGLISTAAFIIGVSVLSEKYLKKTGSRTVLLWELK